MKTQTLHIGTTIVAAAALEAGDGSRRDTERLAVSALISALYGDMYALGHTPGGAPLLVPRTGAAVTAPHISVTHSRDLAAVAVDTTRPVGIDAETWRPALDKVRDRYLTPAEQERCVTPALMLRAWTAKEAVYKVSGGVSAALTDIWLDPDGQTATAPADGGRRARYSLHSIEIGSDTVTLAWPCPEA